MRIIDAGVPDQIGHAFRQAVICRIVGAATHHACAITELTRSADSRSLTRLLITDFETFRRVAAAVTLPDFATLINVSISLRRQFIGRCWLTLAVFGTSSPHAAKPFAVSTVIEGY